jgi:hypothetical protein
MEHFQNHGIANYDQIPKEMHKIGAPQAFDSPARRYTIVSESSPSRSVYADGPLMIQDTDPDSPVRPILVISQDTIASLETLKLSELETSRELIVLVNKMSAKLASGIADEVSCVSD